MQFKGIEKKDIFTTLYYELTWAVGWKQMLSFINVIIKTDFAKGRIQSIGVGSIAGAESVDVTNDLKEHGFCRYYRFDKINIDIDEVDFVIDLDINKVYRPRYFK